MIGTMEIIKIIVVLFLTFIGLVAVYSAMKFHRKITYCSECGNKLSKVKENQSGLLYKECPNPECSLQQILYETLLKEACE